MGNKKLLVMIDDDIDDHEIFRMAIDELAETLECLFFPDCESAIIHFSRDGVTPPGYVFIDIRLPRINGDQCIEELLSLRQFDHPRIIVYSSTLPQDLRDRLMTVGVNQFLQKTGSLPTLINKIEQLLV